MFKFFKCWFFLMRLATTLEVQMDTSLAKTPCDDWVIRMWRRLVECVANIKVQFFQLRGMQQAIAEFCQAFVRGNVLWLDYYLFHGSNFGLLTAMEKTKLRKVQFFLKPSQNASTSLSPKFQLNKVNFCKFEFGNALAILSKTGSKLAFWLSFLQYFYAFILMRCTHCDRSNLQVLEGFVVLKSWLNNLCIYRRSFFLHSLCSMIRPELWFKLK